MKLRICIISIAYCMHVSFLNALMRRAVPIILTRRSSCSLFPPLTLPMGSTNFNRPFFASLFKQRSKDNKIEQGSVHIVEDQNLVQEEAKKKKQDDCWVDGNTAVDLLNRDRSKSEINETSTKTSSNDSDYYYGDSGDYGDGGGGDGGGDGGD